MALPDPPPEEEEVLDSILDQTKQMLGIPPEDTAFDVDVIAGINACFMSLHQIGIGPTEAFYITDNTSEWSDFLDDPTPYGGLKNYFHLKVKLFFDPPGTSFALASMEKLIEEFEERFKLQNELINYSEETEEEEV